MTVPKEEESYEEEVIRCVLESWEHVAT